MKTIIHAFDLPATREDVFRALTSIDGLARWWTTNVSGDAGAGGRITFAFDGAVFNPEMHVTELAAPALVAWRCVGGVEQWADNTFRFELAERDEGTRVQFRQDYATELTDDYYGVYNYNWGYYLESLRLYCETGEGKPFRADGATASASRTALISIAKATAKPDRAADLERELLARVAPTRAQPGNIEFSIVRSMDDPNVITAIERWASREDWERHLKGDHVTSLMAVFDEILAAPPGISVYSPVAAEPA